MKLPKISRVASSGCSVALLVSLISLAEQLQVSLAKLSTAHQEPIATNEILTSTEPLRPGDGAAGNFSQFSRDVTNLRLSPDLRSIKLRWTYEHSDANRPESFRIRYCELTSWMAEIKCRHREMPVQVQTDKARRPPKERPLSNVNDANLTVISAWRQLERSGDVEPKSSSRPVSQIFETQIYDLRALTNYTVQVGVSRFVGEPASLKSDLSTHSTGQRQQQQRHRPSRRLDLTGAPQFGELSHVTSVETTKPFSAEALRCLANSSEVLVNTGRFFGGRISVEGQLDARCQVLGNRSSEQAVYTLNIDHQACHSRTVDANRIETMILVHENKDILTHNTARFLVQCNIGQQSFNVKASISLPKVMNSLAGLQSAQAQQPARPAMITPLASRPASSPRSSLNSNESFDRVQLGSMPGIYRLIRADGLSSLASSSSSSSSSPPPQQQQAHSNFESSPTSNYAAQLDAREADSASGRLTSSDTGTIVVAQQSAVQRQTEPIARSLLSSNRSQARQSKEFPVGGDSSSPLLPKPVDVSSRILFVERASDARAPSASITPLSQREARLMSGAVDQSPAITVDGASLHYKQPLNLSMENARSQQTLSTPAQVTTTMTTTVQAKNEQLGKLPLLTLGDTQGESQDEATGLIMTNNHRVAGDFASLSHQAAALAGPRQIKSSSRREEDAEQAPADFSLKYSVNKVNEYALDKLISNDQLPPVARNNQTPRSRSGRMRSIGVLAGVAERSSSMEASQKSSANIESRMGDMEQETREVRVHSAPDLIISEGSNLSEQIVKHQNANVTEHESENDLTMNGNSTSKGPQHTLAHNITGALIRWSLKTLGNLARKSLESLVADEQNDNVDARVAPRGPKLTSVQIQLPTSTVVPINSSTMRQLIGVNNLPAKITEGPRWGGGNERSHSTPKFDTKPNWQQSNSPSAGSISKTQRPELSLKSSKVSGGRETGDQVGNSHNLGIESTAKPALGPEVSVMSTPSPKPVDTMKTLRIKRVNETKAAEEVGASDRYLGERSVTRWPIYLLWAMCGLVALVITIIYFVFKSPRQMLLYQTRSPAHRHPVGPTKASGDHLARLNEAFHSESRTSLCNDRPIAGIDGRSPEILAPIKNQNLSYATRAASSVKSVVNMVNESPTSSSSPVGSATTRSTSAASCGSSLSEHRRSCCRNQEQLVVYTDYLVLSDDSSSLAGDGECLTSRTDRRREPNESFA